VRRAWAWAKRKKFTLGVIAIVIVLVTAGAFVQASVDTSVSTGVVSGKTAPSSAGHSVLDILGGVRESLAAYFWTKTDSVFHDYFKGNLANDKPLFPYYWMITQLDPHFVMPYYYASWLLCQFGRPREGLALAIEGARNNPDSADLQENLAEIYLFFMNDPQKALYHSQKAIEMATSPEQLKPYQSVQNLIQLVISGKRKIERIPFEQTNRFNRDTD